MEPELTVWNKNQWRGLIKQRLADLSQDEYQRENRRIRQLFLGLDYVGQAQTVMIYYSIGREVETVSLIERLLQMKKRVVLPVCTPERSLEAKMIRSLDEVVVTGRFGLVEPRRETPRVDEADLEVVVIPGVAFDRHGNRLGHGMGYYDRFLSRSAVRGVKLGLAYECQVVNQLPACVHDVKIDALVTPQQVWRFTGVN